MIHKIILTPEEVKSILIRHFQKGALKVDYKVGQVGYKQPGAGSYYDLLSIEVSYDEKPLTLPDSHSKD